MGKYNLEKLLYRRQFILGPRFIEDFPGWKKIRLRGKICLTVHPDLPTYQIVNKNIAITLLGYVLDPNDPHATDSEIIDNLMRKLHVARSLDEIFAFTYEFGGRWILIVEKDNDIWLFNDPMGLRQVFYTNNAISKEIWCATQPGIISEILNLEMDKEAVKVYINLDVYKNWEECLWPGDGSPYKEITHLLPNRYLDLNTGSCYRYWPDRNLDQLSIEEVVEENATLLKNLIKSAYNRFKLAFTITAGWDTRLLLAASKEFSSSLYYFSVWRKGKERDAIIPRRLLPKLGLKHNVIKYPLRMEEEFERIYKRNVTGAHYLWGTMAQGLYKEYPQGWVCVKGNAAEISRVRFRVPEGEKVTLQKLSMFFLRLSAMPPSIWANENEMARNSYVNKLWEKWLLELGDIYNIHVLDLFYWEQGAGNFAATGQAEWDIVQEVFTPYNCRRWLMNMLSVDEKFRDHDHPILYQELIMKLWPEVLGEPVNPPHEETSSTLKNIRMKTKNVLVKTHLYQFIPERIKKLGRNL